MHENRATSEVPEANVRDRPAGEGKSRTARMHAFEESDCGIVPMNHSTNKSGKPQAETGRENEYIAPHERFDIRSIEPDNEMLNALVVTHNSFYGHDLSVALSSRHGARSCGKPRAL